MPETLDRCVSHVMDQGHSESSAYAICRSSLGMMSDGTEDEKDMGVDEEQMKARVTIAMQFQNGPALVKEIVACGPMGKFVNGDKKGVVDRKRLAALADRFKKYRRQVPIFMTEDHPETNDQAPAVGWVEGLRMVGDDLVARVKLHGPGAVAVGGDLIRGASIYTVNGKNYDGTPQGEILKHLLLTNEPFYKEANIAAADQGEAAACIFTVLTTEEKAMPDPKVTKVDPAAGGSDVEVLALRVQNLETLVEEKTRENLDLTAANANLMADVERFKANPGLAEATKQLQLQERQLKASKIRRLVKDGVDSGQFDRALVGDPKSGYDHPSDEGVLLWFKTCEFKDSFDKLEFALAKMPAKTMGRTFAHGEGDSGKTMTDGDKEYIRSLGQDPDQVMAAMKAKDARDYAAATAKE